MQDFFSTQNLVKSAKLAAILTLMSLPRLAQAGMPMSLYLPAAFATMIFMSGAVAAWGTTGGMPGIWKDRTLFYRGATIAVGLSVIALPIQVFWLDPLLRHTLELSASEGIQDLAYPPTMSGKVALLLWTSGFQVMFLHAAAMSFFVRLTKHRLAGVALCLALRLFVASQHIQVTGMEGYGLLFGAVAVIPSVAQCLMFAYFGLLPSMLLAAGLTVHVFFG